jgi:hypothetical protein
VTMARRSSREERLEKRRQVVETSSRKAAKTCAHGRPSTPKCSSEGFDSVLYTPHRQHAGVLTPWQTIRPGIRERHELLACDLILEGFGCKPSPRASVPGSIAADKPQEGTTSQLWLTGVFVDYVLCRFARKYTDTVFLPTSFAAVDLPNVFRAPRRGAGGKKHSANNAACASGRSTRRGSSGKEVHPLKPVDVLGRAMDSWREQAGQAVFLHNPGHNHWTLVRVVFPGTGRTAVLQLFEPMGKPAQRKSRANRAGVSRRNLPVGLFEWLDKEWPLKSHVKWSSIAESAMTERVQENAFDCGVACLLCAELAAQQGADSIAVGAGSPLDGVNQCLLTQFRASLERVTTALCRVSSG